MASDFETITTRLCMSIPERFSPPVSFAYNPLTYAAEPWKQYCSRFGGGKGRVLLVGLNPGPFGMAQTGVPFGEVSAVRDWMGITAQVGKPDPEHPKRPVTGFGCTRSEISGKRLWGWAADRFGTAEAFFSQFFVTNYCPLIFMEASGRNLTPDKLDAKERQPLFKACDNALKEMVDLLEPTMILGFGAVATKRIRGIFDGSGIRTGTIPHPSPANPAANRGWAALMDRALAEAGVSRPSEKLQ